MWNLDSNFKQRRPIILVDIDDTINRVCGNILGVT